MRVLIAPDKFKGTLSAAEAAQAIATSLDEFSTIQLPVADGGEGTASVLKSGMDGRWVSAMVKNPLGRDISAAYCIGQDSSDKRVAVLDMSSASGLALLKAEEQNPWTASTYGTGQLILAALEENPDRLIVGVGGSATNDGGSGMAAALGYRFLNARRKVLENLPAELIRCTQITPIDRQWPEIVVACDVDNPLLGPRGATQVYGPQKGILDTDLPRFENRLQHLAKLVDDSLGVDFRDLPGAGAAGGLGFGLASFCGARLRSGFDLVAKALHLEKAMAEVDLVITGEGRLDRQSLMGKGPGGVARMAAGLGLPVIAVCGKIAADDEALLRKHFDAVIPMVDEDTPERKALEMPLEVLTEKVSRAKSTIIRLGRRAKPDRN